MFRDRQNCHVIGCLFVLAHLYVMGATLVEGTKSYTYNGTGTGRTNRRSCAVLSTRPKIREELALLLEKKTEIVEINITFDGYSSIPLQDPDRKFYKPWLWVRTTSRHGQALLMLPFHYQMLSLWTLSVGTERMNAELKDEPTGCLETLGFDKRLVLIREFLLNDFKPVSGGLSGSLSENEYVCVQKLTDANMYGQFVYECCRYGPDGEAMCLDLSKDFWIYVLEKFLTVLKILIFLFFPLILPDSLYRPMDKEDQYRVNPEKPVDLSIYVSDDTRCKVRGENRLDAKQLSKWTEFNKLIKSKGNESCPIPWNKKVTLSVENLLLTISKRRLISMNSVPIGLLAYLNDNFYRCQIRHVDPFVSCCKASICGTWKPTSFQTVTWLRCFQFLIRLCVFILAPLPFYIRLGLYTAYEHDEMLVRKEALQIRGLREEPTVNTMQYFSPTHPFFVIIYVVYLVEGTGIRLLSTNLRRRFKFVLKKSFREVKCLEIRKKLIEAGQKLIYPLETYGCFGFIVGIFYWLYTIPFLIFVVCVYYIPMIYLTGRVVHSFLGIVAELNQRRGTVSGLTKRKKLKDDFEKERKNLGIVDFLPGYVRKEGKMRLMMKPFVYEVLLEVFVLVCTIASIYAMTILLVECVGFFLEMFSFTLMGIIVNAGQIVRYVSLLLLVALYVQDCFKNVRENYLALGQKIIVEAHKKVEGYCTNIDHFTDTGHCKGQDDCTNIIQEVASKSEKEQTNMGFVVKLGADKHNPPLKLAQPENSHLMPQLEFFRPILFLDRYDKRYVPLSFFETFTTVTSAGCPGPILNHLLKATRKFLIMMVFLGFVFIVVLVFGDSYGVSSTNQTLATVVGGTLPWLLNNFVKGKKECLSLNDFSFPFLFDVLVRENTYPWKIRDIRSADPGKFDVILDEIECQPTAVINEPEGTADQPEVTLFIDLSGGEKETVVRLESENNQEECMVETSTTSMM